MSVNEVQALLIQVARLETILNEVVVPQAKKSVTEWNELKKLNISEKLKTVSDIHDRLEETNIRLIAIEDNYRIGIDRISKRVKKIEKDMIIYKYTFSGVVTLFILAYSRIIIIDPELISKYISIFSVLR